MSSRSLLSLLLLAGLAATAGAAGPPSADTDADRLLPATTQVFVHWDGVKAHRDAYRRSAIGQMLAGELGRSIRAIWGRYGADVKLRTVGDKLLEGVPPAELRRRDELVSASLALAPILGETGFVAGFEVRAIPPSSVAIDRLRRMVTGKPAAQEFAIPFIQFTAVFPGAKNHPEVVRFLDKLSAYGDKGSLKQVTVKGRSCYVVKGGPAEPAWTWWLEGTHLVVVGSLGDPVPGVSRVLEGGAGVTGHRMYQSLKRSPAYEVTSRGFVDSKEIFANVRWLLPPVAVAGLEDAGLLDIHGVRFWEGFEGEASRAVWEVDFNPRQRGVSRFLVKKSINLKDLPPLPADAYRWTAARTNVSAVYDLILTIAAANQVNAPATSILTGASKAFAEAKVNARKEIDNEFGVKFDDMLGALGDTFVTHTSWSDGISSLGQVVAVSVKDERTLSQSLDRLLKKLPASFGPQARFRKRSFHGAVIREIIPASGSPISFAGTIHKGWLVLALNPQPIQGFILRSEGKLDAWKPDERTARALEKIPADAGLVQVVDPRTTVSILLSASTLAAGVLGPFNAGIRSIVDPGEMPHAGAVTKHLFPNVSWTTFDGKTFRIESRESLWLPLQEVGMEMIFPFLTRFF